MFWNYLAARLEERSTWAGMAAALTASGASLAAYDLPPAYFVVLASLITFCGVMAAALPTGGGNG